jgi:hypothetical protein
MNLIIIHADELRQATRMVFDATIIRMSDEEANETAQKWQHHRRLFFQL